MSVVVKLGGHALDDLRVDSKVLVDLASDLRAMIESGTRAVIVHGGGPQISDLLVRLNRKSTFVDGLRVSDEATVEVVAMALALVNHRVVAALATAGLNCVGIAGVDGGTLRARPAGAPWGRAGIDPKASRFVIDALWSVGVTPVVSPISLDDEGDLLNCNADAAAGALAGALECDTLVMLSDVDQLRTNADDPTSAVTHVTMNEALALLETGAAREGMRPKLIGALDALRGGASRVVMANGRRPRALRGVLAGEIPTTEVTR